MFNTIRPYPLSENPNSSRNNRVGGAVSTTNLVGGPGININYNAFSTTITTDDDVNRTVMIWQGDYDFNAEYIPGDVVRVPYDKSYINQNSASIPVGSTDSERTSGEIPMSIGLFVCVKYVPPGWCTEAYVTSNVLPQFGGYIPDQYLASRFYEYNVYYPIFPEIPATYTSSVSVFTGEDTDIIANDTFWRAMPIGMQQSKVCQNGTEKIFYIMGVESGSKFDPTNLPYSP